MKFSWQEGSTVAIGDKLLQYDKTKLELDVESKELAVKEADLKIDTAQKQLKKLQNTKPAPSSKPTTVPIPTAKPTVKPEPTIPSRGRNSIQPPGFGFHPLCGHRNFR